MLQSPLVIDSKLPMVGTTIFTIMSRLAADCGAINLSQGFPDFQADPALFEATVKAMRDGRNQYPPMAGLPELRAAIADKVEALYDARYDAEQEITVTAGATQALFTAIAAFVRAGDEVIVFAPCYDSYVPAIETVGGKAIYARLGFPDYVPDWDQVRALISARTRMIIINSPHNPSGSLLDGDDLAAFYQAKRDFFRAQFQGSRFELLPFRGTYFQLVRYSSVSDSPDREFAEWLTREVGVAVIPVSAFYPDGRDDRVVRFCFAKQKSTLAAAGEKLRHL